MRSLDESKTLTDNERAVLSFDHTTLGEKVAESWGFPEAVRAAIRYHHASINYRGEDIDTVRCVEVANLICTLKGISSVGAKLVRVVAAGPAGALARQGRHRRAGRRPGPRIDAKRQPVQPVDEAAVDSLLDSIAGLFDAATILTGDRARRRRLRRPRRGLCPGCCSVPTPTGD